MTRFLTLLALLATVVLMVSCDRFTHNFEPPTTVDFEAELFNPLQTAFDGQPAGGIDLVMAYFSEDYMHFGQNKADRRAWLEGIWSSHPTALADITLLNAESTTDSTALANWRLLITTPDKRAVVADSIFSGERLIERSGEWLLKGNQMTCQLPTPKQRVIIEYFSFLGCPNCPIVEAELHDLQLAYPDQLSYMEHHVSGPLSLPGEGTFAYYGSSTVPASVFQGEVKLVGSGTDVLEQYLPLAQSLADVDSKFRYTAPTMAVEGQMISGSIAIEALDDTFDYTDLVLNYVLIERVSSFNNTNGIPLKNLVRAKGSRALTQADLEAPVSFVLNSTVAVPDDASLVLFLQTKPTAFDNNATIHSGTEIVLSKSIISFK